MQEKLENVFVFPRVCGHPCHASHLTNDSQNKSNWKPVNHKSFVQTTRQMASKEKWNDANARKALVVCIYFQS